MYLAEGEPSVYKGHLTKSGCERMSGCERWRRERLEEARGICTAPLPTALTLMSRSYNNIYLFTRSKHLRIA